LVEHGEIDATAYDLKRIGGRARPFSKGEPACHLNLSLRCCFAFDCQHGPLLQPCLRRGVKATVERRSGALNRVRIPKKMGHKEQRQHKQ
jgi:hypothetical protein